VFINLLMIVMTIIKVAQRRLKGSLPRKGRCFSEFGELVSSDGQS
jgi:hypothetical protein